VSITVAAPPPTAAPDSASTRSGTAVVIDVAANDDANGGGALTVASVGDPAHGTATIRGGEVVYTPAADFVGTERFDYSVSTAYGTATATVTVAVAAADVSSPPAPPADTDTDAGVANTGTDSGQLLDLAAGLLLAGGVAVATGRRRRPIRRDH
jgi:LPXTG-motif cell wall-anchored protein